MLEHDDPAFPNWDQDETALAERYWEQQPAVVSAELAAAAGAMSAAIAAVGDDQWQRPGRRSNGSRFTVETLTRYFLHDLVHHAHDVAGQRPLDSRISGERVARSDQPHCEHRRAEKCHHSARLRLRLQHRRLAAGAVVADTKCEYRPSGQGAPIQLGSCERIRRTTAGRRTAGRHPGHRWLALAGLYPTIDIRNYRGPLPVACASRDRNPGHGHVSHRRFRCTDRRTARGGCVPSQSKISWSRLASRCRGPGTSGSCRWRSWAAARTGTDRAP